MKQLRIAALLGTACLLAYFLIPAGPDGRTRERRQQILRALPKGYEWTIDTEIEVGGMLVAGMYTDDRDGLAVFVPQDDGKYELRSTTHREKGRIVVAEVFGGQGIYSVCRLNRNDLAYAEIRYDSGEPLRLEVQDGGIVYAGAPGGNYTMHISYCTRDGEIIE